MIRLVLDTHVLGEFLLQYFSPILANRGKKPFLPQGKLSRRACDKINEIVASTDSLDAPQKGTVIIPPITLVELARKWDDITSDQIDPQKITILLNQPPQWLTVATWDMDLVPYFLAVPEVVWLAGQSTGIEWTDAVVVATALSYGNGNYIATRDGKIKQLAVEMRRFTSL